MVRRPRRVSALLAVAAAFTFTGCSALEQSEEAQVEGGAGAESGPIIVGHLTPKSGFLGQLGAQDLAGARFAVEEINENGGLLDRQIEIVSEDSVDPGVAVQKATRLVEEEQVDALFGEISSASGLAIADIADRTETIYFNTGWNSNEGRSEQCSQYVFHIDGNNSMYVSTVGLSVTEQSEADQYYMLTADYAFGHDLRKETLRLLEDVDGELIGDVLVPTGTRDYTTHIRKINAAKPDAVFLNLAGEDQTTFLKQYTQEYGAPYEVTGGVMDTLQFWAAGEGNLTGTWPATYYHMTDTPANKEFVAAWREAHNDVPPDNQAWQSYVAVKIWADAVEEAGTIATDEVVETLRSGMEFDVLKERPASFRKLDNQLMYDMSAVKVNAKDMEDEHDIFDILEPVPGPDRELGAIQIPEELSKCTIAE
jgi:branched-chain amino acid transport system substrate-binding protein